MGARITAMLAIVFYLLALLMFFAVNREPHHLPRPPSRIEAPAGEAAP